MASLVGLRRLREKIEHEIIQRNASLGRGDAGTYEHYRQSVGYIEGLNAAIALIEEIEKGYD